MVEDRITDGRRIAELLSSELDGREDGLLEYVAVTDADRDVEPSADGARAYDVTYRDERIARAFVHEDRAHLEFEAGQDRAADAASDLELRVRPKATEPPKTLVFLESGAAVKRATDVVQRVGRALEEADDRTDA
ncbi:hypothetical protein A6E15_03130 [Natrinema saccharevitans]|uniref:DUF7993 domain-containing protein n=1 Tax=Natrinema saccharevitans TaxID=301967 RepID=A0A1S8AT66_9EURY|nr:hypothetical protein [Natrinema saccharevitans]OLZ40033.1 hypothetical protein A6E15_03130 [Natrinema saccharevitans]